MKAEISWFGSFPLADATPTNTLGSAELHRVRAQFNALRKAYRILGWSILSFFILLFLPSAITIPGTADMDFFWLRLPAYMVGGFSFIAYLNYLAEVDTTARTLGENVFVYVVGTVILHVCGPMISYYLLEKSVKRRAGDLEASLVKR